MSSVQNTLTSARQFVREHAVQFRGDAINLQQIRQTNAMKYQRLRQQNIMINNLKKALLDVKHKISCGSKTIITFNSTTSRASSASSSSASLSSTSTTTATTSDLTYFDQRRPSFWHPTTKPKQLQMTEEEYEHAKRKDHVRIKIIDMYLKAIDAVQKHYRRVTMSKVKDELIRYSTFPAITLCHDDTPAAFGFVKYPDRLLHAANLEDSLDRCLAKQQCIIHEASTKMPPSLSLNIVPSSMRAN